MLATFGEFRAPGDVKTAVADGFVGPQYNQDDGSAGENVRRPAMAAITTYTTRSRLLLAVVHGH